MVPDDDSPAGAYSSVVGDIIAGQDRDSSYQPASPVELFIRDRRAPTSVAKLSEMERTQFARMWPDRDLDRLLREGDEQEDMPLDVEVATVVDQQGTPRYTLWGWNFGVVYLMAADGLDCLAFACQHDLEHWHADQRALFWAMDRALRRGGHGFGQPMKFCWWRDECWDELAGRERGAVGSESYIRRQFAGQN